MKNNFLKFFVKSKILTENEFNLIKDKCDFLFCPKEFKISIDVNSLIDPSVFFKLFNFKKKSNENEVEIFINNRNSILDSDDVQKYIDYFLLKSNNILLKNIINRKKCEINNNDLIIFYLNINERDCLLLEEKRLLTFFKNIGINFEKINFILDEKHKEIELFKIKKNNENLFIKRNENINNEKIYKKRNIVGDIDQISSLVLEQQKAIIFGKVFKISKINLPSNKIIYKYFITDNYDSIIIKAFQNDKLGLTFDLLNSIKEEMWIKAKINLNLDKYEKNQLVGSITQISIEANHAKISKKSLAEKKRVEFINHTKMTAFEGLLDPKEFTDELINLGYKYLSITDKFNCQIFPIIYNYKKHSKKNINLIYGFQTHFSNDIEEVVINCCDKNINDSEYVIFDIETTGLYPLVDDIIEFGAVKYKNGKIIQEKNFFIKSDKKISKFIKELTGITNEMISEGLEIKDALKEIKEFFGDAILVAHNGKNFDIKFINKKLEENNLDLIKNPLIDTLLVSRWKNKKFKSHSLSYLARKLSIFYNESEAHRAVFDAKVLLEVWRNMLDFFESNEILNLNDINNKLNCIEIISKNRHPLINIHVKNQKGINDLYNLISASNTTNFLKSILFKNQLINFKENLFISNSPTEGNIIFESLFGTNEDLKSAINFYDFIFVSPISCWDHEINRKTLTKEDIEKAIKRIIELSDICGKKVIASGDTYYLHEEDEKFYEVYVHTKSIGGKRHRIYSHKEDNSVLPKLHFRSTDELLQDFSFLGKEKAYEIVVENSNHVVKKIDFDLVPIKEKLSTPIIEGSNEKLESLVKNNMILKYGENPNELIIKRINKELKAIIQNGFSVIYWFSHLLVKKSLDDGYIVGSRGSIGSSIIATLLKITEVNPLPAHYLCSNCKYFKYVDEKINSGFDLPNINCPNCNHEMSGDGHNIPFETFMGFNGEKVPDIDLNFSAEYQYKAHDFIRNTFGKQNVLRAGTIGTVAEKTAFGYVKNFFETIGKTDVRDAEIVRIASKCEGVKRTTGQHPGGIIVIPKEDDVFNFTPYNFPADDNTQDWYTTHFAFEFLHDSLLKFDILGHDSPTVIKMLETITGIKSDKISNYDKKVMDIFKSSSALGIKNEDYKEVPGTLGIPEFGTNFVREMLLIIKPKNFSDLVRISGLSHGTNVWTNNSKDLIEKNNLEISEVISARDDIMIYLMSKNVDSLLAFQIMENVRKGNGLNKDQTEILKTYNIPDWYIQSCNKIKYLFPKAHATAYVSMAWKIAWYKVYYPLHFYASYFSIRSTVFDLKTIIKGKNKIEIVLNDIKNRYSNRSISYTISNKEIELIPIYEIVLEMIERGFEIKNINIEISLEKEYIIFNNSLIPPFSCLDGIGDSAAKSIIEARKEKKFSSKDDFLKRTKISKTLFQTMNELGILNNLMDDDQISLFE